MSVLSQLIKTNNLSALVADEIVTRLQQEVNVKFHADPVGYAGLALQFGADFVGQIDEILKAMPGHDWVRIALSGPGLDFSSDQMQSGIQSLADANLISGETAAALKAVGIIKGPYWQQLGLSQEPTPEEAQAALDELAAIDAEIDWSLRAVKLSLNVSGNVNIACIVNKAAIINDQWIEGDRLDIFQNSGVQSMTDDQATLRADILAAVNKFTATLG